MAAPGSARLTLRERQCLALVGEGFVTKEIARRLDLSAHTINDHVESAMRKLGAGNRRDAARLAAIELPVPPPERLGGQPLGMADPRFQGAQPISYFDAAPDADPPEDVRDSGFRPAAYLHRPHRVLPIRKSGERNNDLTPLASLVWGPIITLIVVLTVKLLTSGIHDLRLGTLLGYDRPIATPSSIQDPTMHH